MHQIMNPNLVSTDRYEEICDKLEKNLTLEVEEEEEVEADNDGDDFEFFIGGGDPNSPVSADDIFQNGQIRPLFPFSDEHAGNSEEATTSYRPPVRKVFVMSSLSPENDDVAEGPYCVWSSEKSAAKSLVPAPEMSRKSNSTGLSKLWRVRDLMNRSHSDGKDAFVFLTGKSDEKVGTASLPEKKKKKENIQNIKVGRGNETAPYCEKKGKPSAYEVYYRKKEKKAGKSYLPYRQDLVGFFTNANGMSRNVHPY